MEPGQPFSLLGLAPRNRGSYNRNQARPGRFKYIV